MKAVLLDGLWGAPWRLRGLGDSMRDAGFEDVRIFSYDSSGRVPIEFLADEFAAFLGGGPAVVAAHSMGGLIARLAKLRHPTLDIVAAAFLCTPHCGSLLAYLLPLAGVRQMRPRSRLLRQLDAQSWGIPTLAVWCPGDLLVFPGTSARWKNAEALLRCDIPLHNWPLVSPCFRKKVAAFLAARASAVPG